MVKKTHLGKEVGEGKYLDMYMKVSKHEIEQGAGNNGEAVDLVGKR